MNQHTANNILKSAKQQLKRLEQSTGTSVDLDELLDALIVLVEALVNDKIEKEAQHDQ